MWYLLFPPASFLLFKIYYKLKTGWCKSQTCLVGKTTIVTGANTGIGYETALDFAKRGARVILACRDEERAENACARIIEETGNENVCVRLVDMSSFGSVRAFAKKINETEDRLDILVNNAGIGTKDHPKSQDGQDLVMQVNYFSSFLLTNLLIDLMKKTGQGRIVNVSSLMGKYVQYFDMDKLVNNRLESVLTYNYSKLCNILFTKELARKLAETGITTYSLHPGIVSTEIFRTFEGPTKLFVGILKSTIMKTSEEGAQTTIFCSIQRGIEKYNGDHFHDCRKVKPYRSARDPELPAKLWAVTRTIVRLQPSEDPFVD